MGTVGSGRCHGPECQQAATDGPWCSTTCQEAWHTQFHWLHGDGKTVEPVLFSEPDVVVSDDAQAALAAALDAAQPQLEAHLAAVIQAADPPPPPSFTVAEVARIASSLPRTTPEPAKLTREQFDALTSAFPNRPGWCPNGELGRWDGVPVEFVETVEESTPYLLERRSRFARLSAGIPAVIAFGTATSFNLSAKLAMDVEQLNVRLRTAFPDRADEAIAEAQRRAHSSLATYEQAVDSVIADPEFASAGATYQQVASTDPQVGFLAKWISRLRFWRGTIRMEDTA